VARPLEEQGEPRGVRPLAVLVSGPQFYDDDPPSFPVGIAALSGSLHRHEIETIVFDLAVPGVDIGMVIATIKRRRPVVVGVAHVYTCLADRVNSLCRAIRQQAVETCIVIGGVHASHSPRESLIDSGADLVVLGEAEVTLAELILCLQVGNDIRTVPGIGYLTRGLYMTSGARTPVAELDELADIDYGSFDMAQYAGPQRFFPIVTARGCPFPCTYCSSAHFWGRTVRRRSVARVATEMKLLKEEYGVTLFDFQDDTFTVNKHYVYQLAGALRELDVRWTCETRADCVTEDLLRCMKDSGCVGIRVGVESANDATLKLLDRRSSLSVYESFFSMASRIGIRVRPSIMIGLPGETEDDIRRTVTILEQLPFSGPMAAWVFTPIPGTRIHDARTGYQVTGGSHQGNPFKAVIDTKHLTRHDIDRIGFGAQVRLGLERTKSIPRDIVPEGYDSFECDGEALLRLDARTSVYSYDPVDFWRVRDIRTAPGSEVVILGRLGEFYLASGVTAQLVLRAVDGEFRVGDFELATSLTQDEVELGVAALLSEKLLVQANGAGSRCNSLRSARTPAAGSKLQYLGSMFG